MIISSLVRKIIMNSLIRHRWKIIFGILALVYLLLGTWLYLAEFGVRSVMICPPETVRLPMQQPQEPNLALCQPSQPQQFDLRQMLVSIFLMPLIIGIVTTDIVFILPIFGLFALDKLWQVKRYTLALIPLACALTILFLTVSLYFPIRVQTPDQFKNLRFGLPLRFIIQDQYYSPEYFPYTTRFSSVLENPTRILWPEFIASFLLIFIVNVLLLKGLVLFLQSLRLRTSKF